MSVDDDGEESREIDEGETTRAWRLTKNKW